MTETALPLVRRRSGRQPAQDLRALRYAVTARQHQGFRRAAEALGISQSLLSRRILALEDGLGVSLFQRVSGGVQPTSGGDRFLDEAQQALQLLDAAVAGARLAADGATGWLRIGHVWPVSAGRGGPLFAGWLRALGGVEAQLREGSAEDLAIAVARRDLDVALLDADDAPAELERRPLWSEPWVLAAAPDAPEPPCAWAGQALPPVLCAAGEDVTRIRRIVAERGGSPHAVRVQDTSPDVVLSLVAAGVGWAIVPQSVAAATRCAVRFGPLPGPPAELHVCVAWRRDNDNPALARFLKLAIPA